MVFSEERPNSMRKARPIDVFIQLKYLVFAQTLILILFLQSGKGAASWSFTRNVGVVSLLDGKGCLAIRNPSALEKSRLRVVSILSPRPVRVGKIGSRSGACAASTQDPEMRFWQVRLVPGTTPADFPAIGILGFNGQLHKDGSDVSADLDGDGRLEYLRACTSAEGIHFTIWTGVPLKGKLRWHQYYYLGYDVTPSCTPSELSQPN
jgi:hypothetical protein